MFTGNPLPIQQTYSAGGVFNGSVKWDGSSSSQTYQASGVTISVSNGTEDLFALYRVTFQDMGSSYFNTYIKSADMMYQSPNSYSYKTIANMANLNQKMIDYYPDEGSMMGTYNTKVKVNWMNGLSYVNASYSTNAMLYIDYLAPLGEVDVYKRQSVCQSSAFCNCTSAATQSNTYAASMGKIVATALSSSNYMWG